jgi:hypothetical protein
MESSIHEGQVNLSSLGWLSFVVAGFLLGYAVGLIVSQKPCDHRWVYKCRNCGIYREPKP